MGTQGTVCAHALWPLYEDSLAMRLSFFHLTEIGLQRHGLKTPSCSIWDSTYKFRWGLILSITAPVPSASLRHPAHYLVHSGIL